MDSVKISGAYYSVVSNIDTTSTPSITILWYMLHSQTYGQVWHKTIFGVFKRRAGAHTRSTYPKIPLAPSAFPLLEAPWVPGNKPNEINPTKSALEFSKK